jgi:hypothetical protein
MPKKRFYRNNFPPVPGMTKVRTDADKVTSHDRMNELKNVFIANLKEEKKEQQQQKATEPIDSSSTSKND